MICPDYTHYAYRVLWSPEDGEFVGLCAEFPSLSWLTPDQDAALKGIRELVREVVESMAVNDEPVPVRWRNVATAVSSWSAHPPTCMPVSRGKLPSRRCH